VGHMREGFSCWYFVFIILTLLSVGWSTKFCFYEILQNIYFVFCKIIFFISQTLVSQKVTKFCEILNTTTFRGIPSLSLLFRYWPLNFILSLKTLYCL
jgi:hypothetical protein